MNIRRSAWMEIVGFFCFLFLIAWIFNLNFNYATVSPHPFWIVVILISTQYGTGSGLLAALIATLVLLLMGPLPERSGLQERSEYFFILAKQPLLWFIAALILGELRLRQIRERDKLKEELQEVAEREKRIAESYNALKNLKERLEIHIASDTQTALSELAGFVECEEKGKEAMIQGACNLIKALIAPDQFSLYLLEGETLKHSISEGWKENNSYKLTFTKEDPLFQEVVIRKQMISIHSLDPLILGEEGLLAAPIIHLGTVWGMIKIEEIPFLKLKTHTFEALRMIGKWVGASYSRIATKEKK